MQVWSFLLETQQNHKWGACRETACLLRAEVRQRSTCREKGCGRPSWRGGVQERGGYLIYMGQFVWVFVYPQAITGFLFPDLTYARTLPDMQAHFLCPAQRSMGASPALGWCPLVFHHQGACVCNVSSVPGTGSEWLPGPLVRQGCLLCPCRDCHLQGATADKAWLSALFQLWLPFRRANSRLAAYIKPGAYLSPVLGNGNRRLVVSVQHEAHLFLAPRNVNGNQL